MENVKDLINELEEQIYVRECIIDVELGDPDYMILDGEVIDKKTFNTIRKATEKELQWFYEIRLMRLKIKELEKSMPN